MNKTHNKLRFVRRTFYKFKRKFGVPGTLYRVTPGAPNRVTGATGSIQAPFYVDKMMFLPEKTLDKFMYGAGAGGNTARGASFQLGDREVIIDAADLPLDFEVSPEDYIVVGLKRYSMINIVKFETNAGWYLTIRWTQDAPPEQILNLRVQPFILFKQTITGVKV